MKTIAINKDMIPYTIRVRLAGETFDLGFSYNPQEDFFTVDLSRGGEALAHGEKIVYGRALFAAYADPRFPKAAIIPWDMGAEADRVGWGDLCSTVALVVAEAEEFLGVEPE